MCNKQSSITLYTSCEQQYGRRRRCQLGFRASTISSSIRSLANSYIVTNDRIETLSGRKKHGYSGSRGMSGGFDWGQNQHLGQCGIFLQGNFRMLGHERWSSEMPDTSLQRQFEWTLVAECSLIYCIPLYFCWTMHYHHIVVPQEVVLFMYSIRRNKSFSWALIPSR